MEKDLILVIDMQNVYAKGGQWSCPHLENAADKIKKLLDSPLVHEKADFIFTRFLANEDAQGVWKQYNIENAQVNQDPYANAMLDVFEEYLRHYPLYTKSTYSSLTIPQVMEAVSQARRVIVSGVVAECCVLATVMALIDAGSSVIYLTDAVAGIDQETEEAVELILSGLEPLHVKRMTVDQYINYEGE